MPRAPLKELKATAMSAGIIFRPSTMNLKMAARPMPENTVEAFAPPSSPASRTSAQAVPSGYSRVACSLTIRALRRGTMNRTPRMPPHRAIRVISRMLGLSHRPSFAHRNSAGMVKMAPAARLSPAEPMVCTMLLSRMEFFLSRTRMTPIEMTAAGMEAETVMPTRRPR